MTGLKESNYVVLLLGAGSSAHYKPPVMRRFMQFARRRYFSRYADASKFPNQPITDLPSHYVAMLKFHAECEATSARLQRNWDNIEELYTQADLRRLVNSPDQQTAEELCKSIAWVLWDVYRVFCDDSRGSRGQEPTQDTWLTRIRDLLREANLRPVVVTTNYDLVAELGTRRSEVGQSNESFFYPGFDIDRPEARDFGLLRKANPGLCSLDSFSEGVPIVKLHGSVNWFRTNGEGAVCHSHPPALADYLDPKKTAEACNDDVMRELRNFQDSVKRSTPANEVSLTPEIVPPMLGKVSVQEVIGVQWRAAIDAMRRAREIWVIGYSFPTTDAFMQRLLHEGLRENADLDQLVVVDIEPEQEWETRLRTLLAPIMRSEHFSFYRCSDAQHILNELSLRPFEQWHSIAAACSLR